MESSTATRPRVFLDSSVFFAAAYSFKGSAYQLLQAALGGAFTLVLSDYVLHETERNILSSAPHVHDAFLRFRAVLPYQISDPPEWLVADTARLVVAKDAPIVAAARAAEALVIATYDRKHLLAHAAVIQETFGIIVETPEAILKRIGEEGHRITRG